LALSPASSHIKFTLVQPATSTCTTTSTLLFGASVDITFKDCGADDATVTGLTPNALTLGQSQAFTGNGTNKKHITGGTFKMSMTGIGGVSLLGKCAGDLSSAADCSIGLGPITIGKLSFGGLKFPQEPGTLSLPDVTTISLPKALPKFALSTTTKLEATDQDGATMICLEIYSKAAADAAPAGVEDNWVTPIAEEPAAPVMDVNMFALTSGTAVGITFKDCGADDATVTGLTPNALTLGQSQAFTGNGTNKKHITGGTFKMSMTGIGGVSLLGKCAGDLSSAADCSIGLGPITIGKLSFGGLKFPQEPGTLSLPDVTTISLPKALPKFALSTTTKLEATDQDGATMICLEIYSKAQ